MTGKGRASRTRPDGLSSVAVHGEAFWKAQ